MRSHFSLTVLCFLCLFVASFYFSLWLLSASGVPRSSLAGALHQSNVHRSKSKRKRSINLRQSHCQA